MDTIKTIKYDKFFTNKVALIEKNRISTNIIKIKGKIRSPRDHYPRENKDYDQ